MALSMNNPNINTHLLNGYSGATLSSNHMLHMLSQPYADHPMHKVNGMLFAMTDKPHLPSDVIDKLLQKNNPELDHRLASNDYLEPHHIDTMLPRAIASTKIKLSDNRNLTTNHVHSLLSINPTETDPVTRVNLLSAIKKNLVKNRKILPS